MAKNIENKFEVGDWIKPIKRNPTEPKYRNVTQKNVGYLNEDYQNSYVLVKGEEIKDAEDYLKALINVKKGDWIKNVAGEIDKIVELPKIENPFEIDSYNGSVNTERNIAGSWEWICNCPDLKVSKEEAKIYIQSVLNAHKNMISFYENRLKEFKD